MSMGVKPPEKMADRVQPCVDDCNEFLGGWEAGFSRVGRNKETDRILLAKSPGLPRRATMGCDTPPLPKRSCSFVAVSAMNEQAIDFANSVRSFMHHTSEEVVEDDFVLPFRITQCQTRSPLRRTELLRPLCVL